MMLSSEALSIQSQVECADGRASWAGCKERALHPRGDAHKRPFYSKTRKVKAQLPNSIFACDLFKLLKFDIQTTVITAKTQYFAINVCVKGIWQQALTNITLFFSLVFFQVVI